MNDAFKATVLVGAEHRDGRLTTDGARSFLEQSLGGISWDHPPETELVELAAPGTWSRVPAAPMFSLDVDRARMLWTPGNVEQVELDPIDRWDDSPDAIDGAVTAAIDYGAITSARHGQAGIGVYPQSCGDQQPVLAVTLGDGAPMLLDPHDWSWPEEDLELEPIPFTVTVLEWVVERANQMVAEDESRGAERPGLDHTYDGAGLRLTCHHDQDDDTFTSHSGKWEPIGGTFRVIAWLPDGGAIVGNGEHPEQFWRTADAPTRAA
jgi:hypothetical protein